MLICFGFGEIDNLKSLPSAPGSTFHGSTFHGSTLDDKINQNLTNVYTKNQLHLLTLIGMHTETIFLVIRKSYPIIANCGAV